jgi:hypothetical protein
MSDPFDQLPRPSPRDAIEVFLHTDGAFEPPAAALARAMALRTRIAARRVQSAALLATVGEWMDLAGPHAVEWLGLEPGTALTGVRDDRGAEIVEAPIAGRDITIVAERTVGEDGIVRFVGEFRSASGATLRGRLAVLDDNQRVVVHVELDAFGMFACTLSPAARAVVFMPRTSTDSAPIVINFAAHTREEA